MRVEYRCVLSSYAIRPRGTRTGGTRVHFVNSVGHEMVVPRTDAVVLAARPAQGHYSGNAKRFQPFPQSGQEWPDMAPFVR